MQTMILQIYFSIMGSIYFFTGLIFLIYGITLSRRISSLFEGLGANRPDVLTPLFNSYRRETNENKCFCSCSLQTRVFLSGFLLFFFALATSTNYLLSLYFSLQSAYNQELFDFNFICIDISALSTILLLFCQSVHQLEYKTTEIVLTGNTEFRQTLYFSSNSINSTPHEDSNEDEMSDT